jgi:hypothetical protein
MGVATTTSKMMMIAISSLKKWGWLAYFVIHCHVFFVCIEIESGAHLHVLYR